MRASMDETAVDAKPNYNKVVIVGVATIVILLIVGIVFLVVGKPSPVSPLADEVGDGVRIIFVTPDPSPTFEASPETSASATPAASPKATPKATPKASPTASSAPSTTPKASASPSSSPATN